MATNDCWKLNMDLIFENYSNIREWNKDKKLIGFIFGKFSMKQIYSVYFGSPNDLDIAIDLIQFIESSLTSDLSFVGVFTLIDMVYNFDVSSLDSIVDESENFLNLFMTDEIMKNRDADEFKKINSILKLEHSVDYYSNRLLVFFKYNLNIYVDSSAKHLLNEIADAFMVEMDNIENICFYNKEYNLLLGYGDESNSDALPVLFKNFKAINLMKDHILLKTLRPISNICEKSGLKYAPHMKLKRGNFTLQNIHAQLSTCTFIMKNDSKERIVELLRTALKRILYLTERSIYNYSDVQSNQIVNICSCTFLTGNMLINIQYPRVDDESLLTNCRLKFHRIFNLPLTKPLLKLSQAFKLGLQTNLLRSPHLSINKYKAKGELSIIQGAYNYHHYMQDGINDNGWGCAYRSFQTIWSFFLIQGYTDKQVPSHREIQQSLHDCGDKDAKFVGSRQWIGSLELSYCLENMLNITSRIIALNSGAEIVDNARQIGLHFKTNGTPIMIGGGMLAYTILGVDFNEITGDCAFLVLDPHYTGDEIIDTVISKGWCGWKPPSFWKSEHFYNLLLPDLPKNFI